MRILFITAHPYLPQLIGGMQTSTDQLCRSLQQRGHHVAVLVGLTPVGWRGFLSRIKQQINARLFGCKTARDQDCGYPVWRAWFPWEAVAYVVRQERPEVIVVVAGEPVRMGLAAQATGTPIIMQLQNVEFQLHGMEFKALGPVACVSNSRFTADAYAEAYQVPSEIIYPFMTPDAYLTETSRANVTFINPVPLKGRDIALRIAAHCPDIPFAFVEAWPLNDQDKQDLMRELAHLPNVTLLPPQKDMRKVYGKCKILLAPSLWNEGYGRVATEAQFSGIPVVASTRGGLPEAVGTGGVVLDPEAPIADWVAVIRKLWEDDAYYKAMSAAALAYANRPDIGIEHHIEMWENVMQRVIGGAIR